MVKEQFCDASCKIFLALIIIACPAKSLPYIMGMILHEVTPTYMRVCASIKLRYFYGAYMGEILCGGCTKSSPIYMGSAFLNSIHQRWD